MKKITLMIAASLMMMVGSAIADSANWSATFERNVEINRCANNGVGNDGERVRLRRTHDQGEGQYEGVCFNNRGSESRDLDPRSPVKKKKKK